MKETDTMGLESILKLKMLQVVEVFFADREGLAKMVVWQTADVCLILSNYITENLSSQSTDELKPQPWLLHLKQIKAISKHLIGRSVSQ